MSALFVPLLVFLLVGLVAGFIAGLLGLGGGIVVVPLLTIAFDWLGVEQGLIHRMAVGTSMGVIIVTSLASAITHHKTTPLSWSRIKTLGPGLVAGTLLGSLAAAHIPVIALKIVFLAFLIFLAIQVLRDAGTREGQSPSLSFLIPAGLAIGFLCSLVGVAGGAVIVPFLVWTGLSMHQAIGSSAALGFFISLAGAAGYVTTGFGLPDLPVGSLGFIHLPALGAIVLGTVITAPRGAKLAYKLTPQRLRRVFAITMLHMAGLMVWDLLKPYIL